MPAKSLERQTQRGRNPVTKTVVAVGLGRGAYAGSANKGKPDGDPKIAVQGSGERSLYPAHVYPHRRAEEAAALARGTIER